jgi:hypothetical protein
MYSNTPYHVTVTLIRFCWQVRVCDKFVIFIFNGIILDVYLPAINYTYQSLVRY